MKALAVIERALEPRRRALLVRLLLAAGLIFQLRQYLSNRSLWLDEAMLALNVINRPFAGLLAPLEYHQAAPVGFLFAERLAVLLFGTSEFALRLLPLACGILSLFVFRAVAERILTPTASLIALLLFVGSDRLTYFASEVKPYSTDVAVALLLWLMATADERHSEAGSRGRWWWLAGAWGSVAIWFSYPAVFVLAGIGIRWVWIRIRRQQWHAAVAYAAIGGAWLASFWVSYVLTLRRMVLNESLRAFWVDGAAPLLPRSYEDLRWYLEAVTRIAAIPLGREVSEIVLLTGILGGVALFERAPDRFYWLVLPGVVAILASGLQQYPLANRLWLFMVPALLLVTAAGVECVWERTRSVFPLLAMVLFGLLFLQPMLYAGYHLARPHRIEEVRPLLEYWREHRRPVDTLYVYYGGVPAVRYYAARGMIKAGDFVTGVQARGAPIKYLEDMDKLRGGQSVWLLFSHSDINQRVDEEEFMVRYLDRMGMRREERRAIGASLYLYDLSGTAR